MEPDQPIWTVTLLDDGAGGLAPILPGTTITFDFDGERVSGTAGCNSYTGPAHLDDPARLGPFVATLMACLEPDGVMEQESRYLHILERTDSVAVEDDRLHLLAGDQVLAVFVPLRLHLDGGWQLRSYFTRESVMSDLVPGTSIGAVFEAGRISGSSGCNRYTGAYRQDGPSLHITSPGGTRMMCPSPDGVMEQEVRYLELLTMVDSYLIQQGRLLILSGADGTELLQFERG